MEGSLGKLTAYLAAATILFRCDIFILAVPVILIAVLSNPKQIVSVIRYGIVASVGCIALTVSIDSFFWKRWLWPEWEVAAFNALANGGTNSSQWGVSPWHWYVTNALPRSLLLSFPLALFAVFQVRPGLHIFSIALKQPLSLFKLDTRVLSMVICLQTVLFPLFYSFYSFTRSFQSPVLS